MSAFWAKLPHMEVTQVLHAATKPEFGPSKVGGLDKFYLAQKAWSSCL